MAHTQAFDETIARPFRGQEATTALTSHSVQLSATRNGYARGGSRPSPLEDPARLWRAAEAGGAGVWEWHVTAGEIHFNAQLASLLGLGAYALKLPTSRFLDVVHGEDTALLRIALQEASKSDQDWSQEFRIRREENSHRMKNLLSVVSSLVSMPGGAQRHRISSRRFRPGCAD